MYKVLLVDDNEAVRLLVKRFNIWNENTGFLLADEAKNGKEALEKLEKQNIDLVITDIRMPVIDGMELLQKIVERGFDLCVVIISDYSEFEYARKGLVLGAFDYLVKPVKKEEMDKALSRVKEHLDNKQQEKLFYPELEAGRLTENLMRGNYSCHADIDALLNTVSSATKGDRQKMALIINNVYKNILAGIRNKYPWADQFIYLDTYDKEFERSLSKEDLLIATRNGIENIIKFIGIFLPVNTENSMISGICEYILSEKEEPSLQDISRKFYMNSSYISSAFREKTGITISDYLLRVKMERAKKMLTNTDVKAFEVANALGYKDTEYFSKQFKKYAGLSPSQYKAEQK